MILNINVRCGSSSVDIIHVYEHARSIRNRLLLRTFEICLLETFKQVTSYPDLFRLGQHGESLHSGNRNLLFIL